MSLAYRQGRVKMAIKALKEVRDIANANIDSWRDMEEEDLMSNQKDIIGAQSLMESKLSTLDIAMDKFLLEADKIDDSDPIAQGKIDESSTKVIEAVDEANKVLDQVLVQVKRIAAANQKRTTPETPSLSHQQQQPVIIHSESRLDYKPPRFKGNKWEFENFWTLYSATVENSGKSNTLKFNCLLNCLEGEPKEWISRFKINDENYPQAVELLKKKYNDKEQIISDLTNQIQKEAAPSTSITDQRKLFEKLFIMTAQLKDYQENIETRMFKDQIVQKFSKSIQSELYKKKIDMDSTEWTVDQIMKDLETIISREEELNKLMKRSDSEHQNKPKTQSFKKDSKKDESDSRKTSSKKCTFCKQEGHWGSNCKVHSSPKERMEILKAENRCFLCTRYGHSIDACRAKACSNCQKNHHFSICNSKNDDSALHKKQSEPKAKTQSSNGSYKPKVQAVFVQTLQDDGSFHDSSRDETKKNCMRPEKKKNDQSVMPTASSVNKDDLETFIPTIQVKAFNPKKNCWETMSLMLDSGASQTYADMKMFKEWNLPDKGQKTVWNRVFGSAQSTVNTYQKTAVRIQLGQGILDMDIFVSDHLVGRIPKSKLSMEDMKFIIQNALVMNQDSLKPSCQPQIILGCDYMSQIMTGEFITLPSGISALGTACGLTTMGRSASNIKNEEQHLLMVIKDSDPDRVIEDEQKMDMQMKTPSEFTGPLTEEQSQMEKETQEHFDRTIELREDGYYARLPLREDRPILPDNFGTSISRLQQVQSHSSKEVLQQMHNVFQEQEEKGIIERVEFSRDKTGTIHYNPCQPVITPHKTTTKCRVVVDGSSHTRNSVSLNDIIKKGPSILPEITDMLTRFRAGKTLIVADVEKAFLQVRLHEEDRDLTRVLWLKDFTKPATIDNVVVYRFTRVLFGLNVSPFLLAATIRHHLRKSHDQELANEIIHNLYVDNLVITTDEDPSVAIQKYHKIKDSFSEMGMNMREFLSNCQKFNEMLDESDRCSEEFMKILGIPWSSKNDTIFATSEIEECTKNSRRTISSALASIYDPMGNLVPLLLPAKLFQRDHLWNETYKWDTKISEQHNELWKQIAKDITGFKQELPRNIVLKSGKNTIVTFTDASKDATACCTYMVNELGSHLIFGKSKIKPLKESWTIPKLETQALKMGSERTLSIWKALKQGNVPVGKVIIMTDSSIALDWLKSNPGKKETGVFITNRLKSIRQAVWEIEEDDVAVMFGHVPTEMNPADLGTRGCSKAEFSGSIWWEGPAFLQIPENEWTINQKFFSLANSDDKNQMSTILHPQDDSQLLFNFRSTNSYEVMKRISSYVLKFIKITTRNFSDERKKKMAETISFLQLENIPGRITPNQIKEAELVLLKDHQKSFSQKFLKKFQNLGLSENSKGLIVCKGRLGLSDLQDAAKEPILLQPNSELAAQIIRSAHGRFHCALDHTMDKVRRQFWIPSLRKQTKQILGKCPPCQRMIKQPFQYPDMQNVPSARVTMTRPFAVTGVDNFGPLTIKKEDGTDGTAYGTILTCAVTRLVHVEIVSNMSALQFLQALRRFIAMRGTPERMISDNGTNFILGQKIVQDAMDLSPTELQPIQWKFITPYSPWKGGFYERMVRSVKHAFQKNTRKSKLSFEELHTVFYEVSASINSRPLTFVEDDVDSRYPLRPMDFVYQKMKTTLPLENTLDIKEDYMPPIEKNSMETKLGTIEAMKSSIQATSKIWNQWRNKYLAELREHHKLRMDSKRGTHQQPKVGQVVIIQDENQPRNVWKLGRITTIKVSKDGIIRDVDLKTENGKTLNRSINQLIPMELDDDDLEEETNTDPTEPINPIQQDIGEQRYNLRSRKKIRYDENQSNEEDSTKHRNFSIIQNFVKPTFLMLLCLIALVTGTSAETLSVKCNQQGIQIRGPFKSFEACSENYCTSQARFQWTNDEKRNVWFPPAINIHPHHVTTKINDGTDIKTWEMDCPAVPFCETIDCTFCASNITNPECHMIFAIVGLGAAAFIAFLLLHLICNASFKLGDVLQFAWTVIRFITILLVKTLMWIREIFRRNRIRRTKWRELLVMVTLIGTAKACQEIDIVTQFETVCNTDGKCDTFTEEIMHLNQFHNEGCLRIEKNGTTLRDIRIQLMEVELHCVKRTITFTQNIVTKVWSSKRCPRMGSCQGDKCANVTRDSLLPELQVVNHFVGNTGCSESCGGPGCGCFYVSSGCLFYRTYALPLSTEPLEIFSCMDYQPVAKLLLTVTTHNSWKNKAETLEMLTPIGRTTSFMDIAVTVETIETPPAPALNSWFIKNESTMATWTENLMPNYICDRDLKKCYLDEQCQCSPAEDRMQCTCKDIDIREHFMQTDKRLPVQSGHLRFEVDQDSVKGKIKSASSTTLALKLTDKWKTTIVKTTEACTVTNSHAQGCYSCEKGAIAEITCHSTSEETVANVECGEEVFNVRCSAKGSRTIINFHGNYAKFQRHCSLDCGGKTKEYFEITGILKYSGSLWTSFYRLLDGNTTVYNEINLPDIGHLFDSYLTYMKTVFIVILIVGVAVLFTYSIITRTGLAIIRSIFRAVITILWLPVRIVQRVRRHAHLHVLLCMIIACPAICPCPIIIVQKEFSIIAADTMTAVKSRKEIWEYMVPDLTNQIDQGHMNMEKYVEEIKKMALIKAEKITKLDRIELLEDDATGALTRQKLNLLTELEEIAEYSLKHLHTFEAEAQQTERTMNQLFDSAKYGFWETKSVEDYLKKHADIERFQFFTWIDQWRQYARSVYSDIIKRIRPINKRNNDVLLQVLPMVTQLMEAIQRIEKKVDKLQEEPEITAKLIERPAATSIHPLKKDEEGPVDRKEEITAPTEDLIPSEEPDQKVSSGISSQPPLEKRRRNSSSSPSSSSRSSSTSSSKRTSKRRSTPSKGHETSSHSTKESNGHVSRSEYTEESNGHASRSESAKEATRHAPPRRRTSKPRAKETLKRRRISPPKTEESPRNRRRSPPQAKTSAQRRRITPPRTQNRPERHETERTSMPVTHRFVLEKDMEEDSRNPCSFCSQRHFSDRCGNCVDMEERKRILTEKNRCWRCLLVRQPGHNCPSRKCFYCDQYGHNKAICTRPETIVDDE